MSRSGGLGPRFLLPSGLTSLIEPLCYPAWVVLALHGITEVDSRGYLDDPGGFVTWSRIRLVLQVAGTLAILAWLPGNLAKLAAMLLVWAIGFGRISRSELILVIVVNVVFVVMNIGALLTGAFRFSRPDALGMPAYEFVMWGFYTLHTLRMLEGEVPPRGTRWLALVMTIVFALPFCTVGDGRVLTILSGAVLVTILALFHDPMDFVYAAYMVTLGALIEYVGVWSGQWWYPGSPAGGVPWWFIPMWGGVGVFTRRLLLPFVANVAAASIPT